MEGSEKAGHRTPWEPMALALALPIGAFDGAAVGAAVDQVGWYLHDNTSWFRWNTMGALWAAIGAVIGLAVAGWLVTRRGTPLRPIYWYATRLAWLRSAVLAAAIRATVDVDMVELVASVTLAVALTVGYFVEGNALFRLAVDRFRLFATLAGALLGALAGAVVNSPGWLIGGWAWTAGGGVLGALAGLLLWGARPPAYGQRLRIPERAAPAVFLAPALLFVSIALLIPTLRTIYLSFFGSDSENHVGLNNYRAIRDDSGIIDFGGWGDLVGSNLFLAGGLIALAAILFTLLRGTVTGRGVDITAPLPTFSLTTSAALILLAAVSAFGGVLWNNIFWIVFVTGFATLIGLVIAVLADRARGESMAKSLIFMPMAISFVGASIIWRFIYAENSDYGLLNAGVVNLGGDPQLWIQDRPWNTMFLIAIMIWIQTGFAMVIFSAAIKGVPEELREAARIDGASEMDTFWRVTLPHIRATVVVVVTTLIVTVLKIYDLVQVMTGGRFGTNVIANQMFDEVFQFRDFGRGSALATLLFLGVVPLMILNVRRVRQQEDVR